MDVYKGVEERIRELRWSNPSISLDSIVTSSEEGDWGVILYSDYSFDTTGFEFIESEKSWQRADAIDLYNGLSKEGFCVVIYVPEGSKDAFIKMLTREGGRSNLRIGTFGKWNEGPITLQNAKDRILA